VDNFLKTDVMKAAIISELKLAREATAKSDLIAAKPHLFFLMGVMVTDLKNPEYSSRVNKALRDYDLLRVSEVENLLESIKERVYGF